MLLFGFFRQIQNGKKWFWTSFKSVISFLLFPKRNIFIRKCKAVTLPWKQLYGLYNQNKNPSILTYSYKQQTFEYISRLNDHVRDSRIWNSEGLPSNTWAMQSRSIEQDYTSKSWAQLYCQTTNLYKMEWIIEKFLTIKKKINKLTRKIEIH